MSKHNNKNSGAFDSGIKEKPGAEGLPVSGDDGNPAGNSAVSETSPAEGNTAPGGNTALEAELASAKEKLAELNDQYLRKAADFENFRKRVNREKQELTDFANQSLLLDLIPVIDDFERAIKSAETSRDFPSFYEGIMMIEKRLSTQLENKWGLKRFDSAGEPFDPNRHEALQVEKVPGIAEAVVQDEFVKGYFLKERVIRFAKVKVLMPENGESAPPAENSEA